MTFLRVLFYIMLQEDIVLNSLRFSFVLLLLFFDGKIELFSKQEIFLNNGRAPGYEKDAVTFRSGG